MHIYQRLTLHFMQTAIYLNAFQNIDKELQLDLRTVTGVIINRTVILKCTGSASNESWYLKKGFDLLIDDGHVYSEYFLDGIHTNHTMETMFIEFMTFNRKYLDVYKCVREKGACSNSLDLNDIFRIESQQAEVICNNVTAASGVRFVNLQCTIKYSGITCDDNIFWENGKTGEVIDTTGELYEVSCEESVNDSFVTTSLNINKVTDEVMRTNYCMVHVDRYQTAQRYSVHTTFNQESQKAEVICNNVTAASGVRFVNLQCTIKYSGITCDENIFWENGKTGEVIDTTGELYEVSCEESVNDSFVTTSLIINKVTDEVMRTNYCMVHVDRYQTAQHYSVHTTFNQDLSEKSSNRFQANDVLVIAITVIVTSVGLVAIFTVLVIKRKDPIRDHCLRTHGEKNCETDPETKAFEKVISNDNNTQEEQNILIKNG